MAGKLYRAFYMVDAKPIITGDYLTTARPNQVPTEGTVVEFELIRPWPRLDHHPRSSGS